MRRYRGRTGLLIIDSSAIVAILDAEPDAPRLVERLAKASVREVAAANYVEAGTVLAGRTPRSPLAALQLLETFLTDAGVLIAPIDAELARAALDARVRFGKGFGGPLNFGDSFAYALARLRQAPLLYIGDDFAKTDVQSALVR